MKGEKAMKLIRYITLGLLAILATQGALLVVYYAQEEMEEEEFVYPSRGMRNPFAPLIIPTATPTWTPIPTSTPLPRSADGKPLEPGQPTPTPVQLPGLVLNGIFWDQQNPMAIINGQFIRPGETIDDAKVVQIDKAAVYLNFEGHAFKLERIEQSAISIQSR